MSAYNHNMVPGALWNDEISTFGPIRHHSLASGPSPKSSALLGNVGWLSLELWYECNYICILIPDNVVLHLRPE